MLNQRELERSGRGEELGFDGRQRGMEKVICGEEESGQVVEIGDGRGNGGGGGSGGSRSPQCLALCVGNAFSLFARGLGVVNGIGRATLLCW